MSKKRIAIYQGLGQCHYELLPFAIDYCMKTPQLEFCIFMHHNQISLAYTVLYEQIFNTTLPWKEINLFDESQFDVILLLTDDDQSMPHTQKSIAKTVCIDHYYTLRDQRQYPFRISTREFDFRPSDPYAYIISRVLTLPHKKQLIQNQSKIHVIALGKGTLPHHPSVLQRIFGEDHTNKLEFHFIDRSFEVIPNIREIYKGVSNVHIYQNVHPDIIHELLSISTYLICNNMLEDHVAKCCSCSVIMAFNYCCKMLISESWQTQYKIQSALVFGKGYTSDDYNYIDICSDASRDLSFVDKERDEHIEHRDAMLNEGVKRCLMP